MAEIRKHNPKTSTIGDLVRAAAGEDVRPVTPGEPAELRERSANYDPFVDEEDVQTQPPTISSSAAGSWFSFDPTSYVRKPSAEG